MPVRVLAPGVWELGEQVSVEVERLDTLAERINEEHRACVAATVSALEHALAAGDLLIRAKAEVRHKKYTRWVEANFEGSLRTAQVYKQLAERRAEIEDAKAQSSAVFSIADALRSLTAPALPPPWSLPGLGPGAMPTEKERELQARQEAEERAKGRREQRLNVRAEYAIRTGNLAAPADVKAESGEWGVAIDRAFDLRRQNAPYVLDALGHELNILVRHSRPEEVGRYLAEPTNDYDEAENRAHLIAELREGVAWLERVLEEVEAAQGREQLSMPEDSERERPHG